MRTNYTDGAIEIPREVGSISVDVWHWGWYKSSGYVEGIETIDSHICTDYELGLSDEGKGAQLYNKKFFTNYYQTYAIG